MRDASYPAIGHGSIELHITMTGKSYSPRDNWRMIAEDTFYFATIADARAWLRDRYGKSKRVPMYLNTTDGTKKVGYVIGFRAVDWSHAPVDKWLQQDWIEFREVKLLEVSDVV